jgi:preprotein translocase subunit SecG
MVDPLMIFHAIVSVLLIVMVLIQFGKGAEAGLFASTDSMMTGSQQGNVLNKITVVLAILFLGNSVLLAKLQGSRSNSKFDDEAPIARPLNSDALNNQAAPGAEIPADASKAETEAKANTEVKAEQKAPEVKVETKVETKKEEVKPQDTTAPKN